MSERKLLFSVTKDDFRIDTFRSGGKGGQHQNKTNSGVRITHIESGAVGESREHREQLQNKRTAFDRCINSPTFKAWHKKKTAEMLGREAEIQKQIERDMQEINIKIETKQNGLWVEDRGLKKI